MLPASDLKALLRARGLRLRKRLGQTHLIDPGAAARIVDACELGPEETVVEIGAGLGALTEGLAARAGRVLAVEVDPRMAAVLAERLADRANVRVLPEDILGFDWARHAGAVAVGAIPYHMTSPILAALCEHRRALRRAVLVLQEEVGQRVAAAPGTKAYGRLSVLVQYGWMVRRVARIPRSAFFPQPAVDSVCLRLAPHPAPPAVVEDERLFFAVAAAAFAHRRKTLVNCLSGFGVRPLERAAAEALIRSAGLPAAVRGEMLSLAQFAAVANALRRADALR
jgi:16S rRNA (adenine1518-N6/adenine1519-N6)-dimethyltransferase